MGILTPISNSYSVVKEKIKVAVKNKAISGANKIAKLSSLSQVELEKLEKKQQQYLAEEPNVANSEEIEKYLAAVGIEIYHEYLKHVHDFYIPLNSEDDELASSISGDPNLHYYEAANICYINVTKWVTDKQEDSLEKLVSVYQVLANESCNIALIFDKKINESNVYIAISQQRNVRVNAEISNWCSRISDALKGNFPGVQFEDPKYGFVPCLNNIDSGTRSVATVSNVPSEKSEKFISQTIEKLLDGIIPSSRDKEYIIILLASPINDVEARKLHLADLYSALSPFASWQSNFTYVQSDTLTATAVAGTAAGVNATINTTQFNSHGTNQGVADQKGQTTTDSISSSVTNTTGESKSQSNSTTDSSSYGGHVSVGVAGGSASTTNSDTVGNSVTQSIAKATTKAIGKAISQQIGRTISQGTSILRGAAKGMNLGGTFGINFARSSNVGATVGSNKGVSQSFTNYTVTHALKTLESQMERLDKSVALGMWNFATYVVSKDSNTANNVAHSYLALTQGEESYLSQAAINLWDAEKVRISAESDSPEDYRAPDKEIAKEICKYLQKLRHPIFGLNSNLLDLDGLEELNSYPPCISVATELSGKELAYSLNFPRKSIAGLPVLQCAAFGRNVFTYDHDEVKEDKEELKIGKIFHMGREENVSVNLSLKSLASHMFVTGSTGAGKTNTIVSLLNGLQYRAKDESASDVKVTFLVIEPAKGEYKHFFNSENNVYVFGTNPYLSPMLHINPFSFPDNVHVFEHIDRLVEIFNVCWPMYAAMPAILKDAIEKAYILSGWNLVTSKNNLPKKIYPSFADVAKCITSIIESSEYDAESKGAYKGSLLTRLNSLTNGINGMIFTNDEISYEQLFDENVIVDLSRVGSSETKSLIMGMLVLKLQEYRMSNVSNVNSCLKHITVLEEAHNILKRTSTSQSSETANLCGKSVEMLANAIAEMRSFGEGFVIVDQAPGLLDKSAIRNTNTKIIMRLPAQEDRELVGRAANLNDDQISELSRLPCGVAAIYQNEWIEPVLCKITHTDIKDNATYSYKPDIDNIGVDATEIAVNALLSYIMDGFTNHHCKDAREERFNLYGFNVLAEQIVKSNLPLNIKTDFVKYASASDTQDIEQCCATYTRLVYDLFYLNSSEVIDNAKRYINNLDGWLNYARNNLVPSIKGYKNEQIVNLCLCLLQERLQQDTSFKEIYNSFKEHHKGGNFKCLNQL